MTAGVTAGERFRSWADIQANAARGASGLAALGVREDDSVALMLRNDFATFEINMAASQLGVYAVPINWHFTPEEAGYILDDCGARVLVAHTDLLAQIAPGVPAPQKPLAILVKPVGVSPLSSMRSILAMPAPVPTFVTYRAAEVEPLAATKAAPQGSANESDANGLFTLPLLLMRENTLAEYAAATMLSSDNMARALQPVRLADWAMW